MERKPEMVRGLEGLFVGAVLTVVNAQSFDANIAEQNTLLDNSSPSSHRTFEGELPSEVAFTQFIQNQSLEKQETVTNNRENAAETLAKIKSTLFAVGLALIATYGVSRTKDGANDFERKVLYTALGVAYIAAAVHIAEVWTRIDGQEITNLLPKVLSPF